MLVVHGPGRPSKILQDRYLAKLMGRKKISFAIGYITLMMRFSFREQMDSALLICWPLDLQVSGLWGVAWWDECWGWEHFPKSTLTWGVTAARTWWRTKVQSTRERERVHPCHLCDKALESLPMPNHYKIFQHIGHVFVCEGSGKKWQFLTPPLPPRNLVYQ